MSAAGKFITNHRPTLASAVAGATGTYILAMIRSRLETAGPDPDQSPRALLKPAVGMAVLAGALFGRLAERHTWPDEKYRAIEDALDADSVLEAAGKDGWQPDPPAPKGDGLPAQSAPEYGSIEDV